MDAKTVPVMITIEGGRVEAQTLYEQNGILAVNVDRGYRYVGDVFQDYIIKDGMRSKRWFASTLVESTLGPHSTRKAAVAELLKWNNMHQVQVDATTSPLF